MNILVTISKQFQFVNRQHPLLYFFLHLHSFSFSCSLGLSNPSMAFLLIIIENICFLLFGNIFSLYNFPKEVFLLYREKSNLVLNLRMRMCCELLKASYNINLNTEYLKGNSIKLVFKLTFKFIILASITEDILFAHSP